MPFQCLLLLLMFQSDLPPEPDPARSIRVEEGLVVQTFATDPMLVDPVALCIDEHGRVYVAETERQERGVEDTRSQPYWNLDDISLETVEDRQAMYEKWAHKRPNGMAHYTEFEDRIRLLVDEDGDGRADTSTIYSDGYNGILDGTGSGVLAHRGNIYYTNIPNLWLLQDTDDDGIADSRTSLLDGFGIRIALRGHDMHGLTWGPDGRLYWSIGDRGYNVTSQEGRHIVDPTSGAVFRCDPDGSNLEVYHTGLRNPQELAFDNYGTLFTGDNNSDAGDRARLVYVVEGGQTGWRMEYQTLEGVNKRGPWVQEGLWEVQHEHQPAWILPPVKHVGSGPSGFVHYPGLGLDERYDDYFFLCDFLGSPEHSRVLAFALEPAGAGYEVRDEHPFVSNLLCTDVDFGYDGRMYISDWVEGWECNENGRIFTVHDPRHIDDARIKQVETLFEEGFEHRNEDELIQLLHHADQRVRLHAQFVLADRGDSSITALGQVAASSDSELARLHAIWGLGMIERNTQIEVGTSGHPMEAIRPLLADPQREVRGQAVRALGEARYLPTVSEVQELIFDPEPRVVYHATMATGRMGNVEGIDAITEMLWANDNRDPYLRHAGVMALVWLDDREALLTLSRDEFSTVRLAVLLALRRTGDPAIEGFLMDPDPFIAAEAARAINDLPIEDSMPALLDRLEDFRGDDSTMRIDPETEAERIAMLRRALYAALRSGRPEDASAVADVAMYVGNPPVMRREALAILADWKTPSVRDRVNGAYRPVSVTERNLEAWRRVLGRALPVLVEDEDAELATAARELAAAESIPLDDTSTWQVLNDANARTRDRIACLRQLHGYPQRRDTALSVALDSEDPQLRGAGLALLATRDPDAALEAIKSDVESGSIRQQQEAILVLGTLRTSNARLYLLDLIGRVITGQLHSAVHVDVLEIAERYPDDNSIQILLFSRDAKEKPEVRYVASLLGGDTERGRALVHYHSGAACMRCHVIDGNGGTAGPDLSDVGTRLERREILESLIAPGAVVTEGYGEVTAMPEMMQHLSPREVRDIVEYLSSLQ